MTKKLRELKKTEIFIVDDNRRVVYRRLNEESVNNVLKMDTSKKGMPMEVITMDLDMEIEYA